MEYLTFTIPGGQTIEPPSGIPRGGIGVVEKFFKNGFTLMIIFCIVVSLIYLVLGGIQWITSGGDKGKVDAARKKITYAIIGLVVAFASFFIVGIIGYFFGVEILSFT